MKTGQARHTDTNELSAVQLKGKQSVRATFRLFEQMIDLLKVTATHLGGSRNAAQKGTRSACRKHALAKHPDARSAGVKPDKMDQRAS